jgi:hypothetical protein
MTTTAGSSSRRRRRRRTTTRRAAERLFFIREEGAIAASIFLSSADQSLDWDRSSIYIVAAGMCSMMIQQPSSARWCASACGGKHLFGSTGMLVSEASPNVAAAPSLVKNKPTVVGCGR